MIRLLKEEEEIPYQLLLLADETIEAIDKYIHLSEIYVYQQTNTIVAVCALQVIDNETVEIKNIAVDTRFQGQGIGSELLKNAFESLTERNFKAVLIGTGNTDSKQLRLYQKLGFEKYKMIENFFVDNYPEPIFEDNIQLKDMIVLKKQLVEQ
jgi:ribosomal protein S18 acetylase RimI-like enzyme